MLKNLCERCHSDPERSEGEESLSGKKGLPRFLVVPQGGTPRNDRRGGFFSILLVLSDRYFFVTRNLLRTRRILDEDDFEILARVIAGRRAEHGLLLTAWVFLPDHSHTILAVRPPKTISLVVESINVASTRQINTCQKESG